MKLRHFDTCVTLEQPACILFDFLADPHNLERVTPTFLRFEFAGAPPANIEKGATIDYRLRIYGVAVRWITLVEVYEPPSRFTYIQLKGPYAFWRHTMRCESITDGGTAVRDIVDYAMPYGPIGAIAHALLIGRGLRQVFGFRAAELHGIFG